MGGGWTGTASGGSSTGSHARPGSAKPSARTRYGMRSSPRRLMPACRCATCKRLPHMPIRGTRCDTTGHAAAWTGTLPTSSPSTSQAPPGNSSQLAAAPAGGSGPPGGPAAGGNGPRSSQRTRTAVRRGSGRSLVAGLCGIEGSLWGYRRRGPGACGGGSRAARSAAAGDCTGERVPGKGLSDWTRLI